MPAHSIRYLKREQVDVAKWDMCIDKSPNGFIYGYSYYLDSMSKDWHALVLGDYEAIMPLTWNKKWGIRYLFQPAFIQQLGIFSPVDISQSLIDDFLSELFIHFRFGEITLNYKNEYPRFQMRSNFIIFLHASYDELYSKYRGDAIRNLNRTQKFDINYAGDIDLRVALEAYRREYHKKIAGFKDSDYDHFETLCSMAQKNGEVLVRAVVGPEKNVLAVAVLLQKKKRLCLIQSTTFTEGRKVEANYFLIDRIINEFSGRDMLLDFEGSDIPGIAHFYKNFGSIDQPYFFFRFNHLPLSIRWMKRT
ncbi:MAG: hypothetical protein H7122_11630 [Chitinophagaceae bacterium]|nr:hypothetical protein [Chitinophagaceae bacterium]